MDSSLLEAILRDEELTAYLQYMVQRGVVLNNQIMLSIKNWDKNLLSKEILLSELEAEIKFQTETTNAKTRN